MAAQNPGLAKKANAAGGERQGLLCYCRLVLSPTWQVLYEAEHMGQVLAKPETLEERSDISVPSDITKADGMEHKFNIGRSSVQVCIMVSR